MRGSVLGVGAIAHHLSLNSSSYCTRSSSFYYSIHLLILRDHFDACEATFEALATVSNHWAGKVSLGEQRHLFGKDELLGAMAQYSLSSICLKLIINMLPSGRPNPLACHLLFLTLCLHLAASATVQPTFVTTMSASYEAGTAVLSASSLTTSGSYSSQTTTVTYLNSYTSTPQFGYGFSYINSVWTQTTLGI